MQTLLDVCGRRRSPATFPEFHAGRPPRNKGQSYPADPPTIQEIVTVLDACPDTQTGRRGRALMALLWRSGLRISEALDLITSDLDEEAGSVLVRRGKGGKRRLVGMDRWGWDGIAAWREERTAFPPGPVFCIVSGPTAGRRWNGAAARAMIHGVAAGTSVQRRVHPHAFRHAHATELWREKVDLYTIMRQLGHANPGITATYLQSIANLEVIDTIVARRAPMIPALASVGR